MKHFADTNDYHAAPTFNRTVVELKHVDAAKKALNPDPFNRTVVELKPAGATLSLQQLQPFNRTVVELKRSAS